MGLETGSYLADLTIANPTAADPKSQGDDHLRLIKTVLRNSFAGFTGAVIVSGTNGGSSNAYTLTPTTALVSYVSPMFAVFIANHTNTGAATLNISSLGPKSIKSVAGSALAAGEIVSGLVYVAAYDGTNFNLIGPTKAYIDQLAFGTALPNQSGNAGKFVTTDGTNASWADVAGRQGLWVPAAAMLSRTTNGAAPGIAESTTNKVMRRTLDFDKDTVEYAQFSIRMPKSWDEGTVTFIPEWSHPTAATNFKVSWGLQAVAISDGEALDAAFGTAQYSNDTGGTADTAYAGPESSAITVAGTPAAEDLVVFQILRKADDGTNDTLAVDARLHGATVYITTNAVNDA